MTIVVPAEGGESSSIQDVAKMSMNGTDQIPAEGADQSPAEGADQPPAEGVDQSTAEGAGQPPADGADQSHAEGADNSPMAGTDRHLVSQTDTAKEACSTAVQSGGGAMVAGGQTAVGDMNGRQPSQLVHVQEQHSMVQLDSDGQPRDSASELPVVCEDGAEPAAGADLAAHPPTTSDDTHSDSSDAEDDVLDDVDAAYRRQKRRELLTHLSAEPPDLLAIRDMACSVGGLLNDSLRKRAWPVLLQLDTRLPEPADLSDAELHAHPYHSQVVMDVERTLKRFPPGIDDDRRYGLQESLVRLIMRSLAAHPELHYYQGYHDVAITVLLVCGERLALPVLTHLAGHHLRVFMAETMDETQDLLTYTLPLLEAADPAVCEFLVRSEAMATFSLPWLITWFSHVLPHYSLITRLFDYVLATSWLAPVYLAAAVVLSRRDELVAGECDLAAVHSLLSSIPADLPWEGMMASATQLLADQPPDKLRPRVDALNRARRRADKEERERLQARRQAAEQRRRLAGAASTLASLATEVGARRWTLVGFTLGVALLAGTIHYWRSRVDQ